MFGLFAGAQRRGFLERRSASSSSRANRLGAQTPPTKHGGSSDDSGRHHQHDMPAAARLRRVRGHLVGAAAAEEAEPALYSNPDPPRLPYTPHVMAEIVAAVQKDGCALIKGVLSPELAAHLGSLLTEYQALPQEEGMQGGAGSQNSIMTLFQRDPDWLALVEPPVVADAMDRLLGDTCHVITMKGWRNLPGYNGNRGSTPEAPEGAGFHVDEMFTEFPDEEMAGRAYGQDGAGLPPLICTALTYLSGASWDLCPTRVIPQSHRSGRRPQPDERCWRENTPLTVIAQPGDCLIFRHNVWHASGNNVSEDVRLCVETGFSQRKVSQKFWPYTLGFELAETTRAAATERQMRLLGFHSVSNYG